MLSRSTPNHWEPLCGGYDTSSEAEGSASWKPHKTCEQSLSPPWWLHHSVYSPSSEIALNNPGLPASQWLHWMRKCLSLLHPMPEVLKGSHISPWSALVQIPYCKVTSAMIPNSIYHCGCPASPLEGSSGQKTVTTLFMSRSSWLSIHELFSNVSL